MNEKNKKLASIAMILIVVFAFLFMFFMWKYAYYIKNHPCELCIDKYGASCILKEAIYYKEGDNIKASSYILDPLENLPNNEEQKYIQEDELDDLFANLGNVNT